MHLQSLKLLHQKLSEEKHLQEIQYFTFDLDLGVKVTQNVAQYPLHHVTHPATKFKVVRSNRLGVDKFIRKFNF